MMQPMIGVFLCAYLAGVWGVPSPVLLGGSEEVIRSVRPGRSIQLELPSSMKTGIDLEVLWIPGQHWSLAPDTNPASRAGRFWSENDIDGLVTKHGIGLDVEDSVVVVPSEPGVLVGRSEAYWGWLALENGSDTGSLRLRERTSLTVNVNAVGTSPKGLSIDVLTGIWLQPRALEAVCDSDGVAVFQHLGERLRFLSIVGDGGALSSENGGVLEIAPRICAETLPVALFDLADPGDWSIAVNLPKLGRLRVDVQGPGSAGFLTRGFDLLALSRKAVSNASSAEDISLLLFATQAGTVAGKSVVFDWVDPAVDWHFNGFLLSTDHDVLPVRKKTAGNSLDQSASLLVERKCPRVELVLVDELGVLIADSRVRGELYDISTGEAWPISGDTSDAGLLTLWLPQFWWNSQSPNDLRAELFVSAGSAIYRARTVLGADELMRELAPSGTAKEKRIRCQVDTPFLEGRTLGGQCVVWWRAAHDVLGPWGAYPSPFTPVLADKQGHWSLHAAHPPERIDLVFTGPELTPQWIDDHEVSELDLVTNPVKML